MKPLLICYSRCLTCKKAEKWLEQSGLEVEIRDIKEQNPTKEELTRWIEISELPIGRFFNTSGQRYRELSLKDRVKTASQKELISILATDGMLVKRPLLIHKDGVLVGFKEKEWEQELK